jgi:hypothetical protein
MPVGCAADVSKDADASIFCTDLSRGKMLLVDISIKADGLGRSGLKLTFTLMGQIFKF